MEGWEWALIIIVVILVIAVIVWVIWFFGIRDTGKAAGDKCANNKECASKTFCNSSGVCQSGTGKKSGETCSAVNDCLIGLTCLNKICAAETIPSIGIVSTIINV